MDTADCHPPARLSPTREGGTTVSCPQATPSSAQTLTHLQGTARPSATRPVALHGQVNTRRRTPLRPASARRWLTHMRDTRRPDGPVWGYSLPQPAQPMGLPTSKDKVGNDTSTSHLFPLIMSSLDAGWVGDHGVDTDHHLAQTGATPKDHQTVSLLISSGVPGGGSGLVTPRGGLFPLFVWPERTQSFTFFLGVCLS